ncbi:uncharacterized protein KRP23_2661 [Phytophthora ramorum]|uniref:uncharacterized protein n=1 Tax=Phytophthora ramorum TaxID=164328 RepID=UPI0030AD2917|nr:hypothetical protein KRP23_2661 [Phytophthora ramorum]
MPLTPEENRKPLIECLDGTSVTDPDAVPTEYVVMDFTGVTAMDATAARSAFLILQKYCSNHNITVLYAGALPDIRDVLVKNEITGQESFYSSADSALKFCENQLLSGARNTLPELRMKTCNRAYRLTPHRVPRRNNKKSMCS